MSSRRGPKMSEPTHDQVLSFVRENSKPFVDTGEVADEFSTVGRRTIWNRLDDLQGRGDLEKYEAGGNTVIWYLPVNYVEEASTSNPSDVSQ